ncbi:MAG: sarcosine oxidase subunit gamma [Candidatus Saccharibacteria bacterium]|nr:sarcosine oxidase subunit gamma [Pseudorhodobacter sp.]
MPELIAKSALSGQGSAVHAGITLSEATLGQITSIACFAGRQPEVSAALGQDFPAPNSHHDGLCWTGPDQAFLIGKPAPDLTGLAATTDQTGGWAALRVTGPLAAEALMRHVPLDLRRMTAGQAARAPLGHMQMILMAETDGFLLLVFRSMARTAWHEIETTLKHMAARKAL